MSGIDSVIGLNKGNVVKRPLSALIFAAAISPLLSPLLPVASPFTGVSPAYARAKLAIPVRAGNQDANRPVAPKLPALTEREKVVHVLNRLSFGPSPQDIQNVESIGIDRYIDQQLHPDTIGEARTVADFVTSSDALTKDPDHLFVEYGPPAIDAALAEQNIDQKSDEGKKAFNKIRGQYTQKVMDDLVKAKLMRAIESPRQLQEVMTEFWFNHFNIYSDKGNDRYWLGSYEEQAIRPYALGKFRDLVGATCHHAAMLFYLDNWQNSADRIDKSGKKTSGLNENYARELMELHTLGVDGGYSQQDVIQLAHILTGLTTAVHGKNGELKSPTSALGSYFNEKRHDFGDKILLGQTIKGSGANEIEQALDMLCKQPATAHHICFQLAQYFVNDNPSPALVDKLSARFLKSDGEIAVVLKELFKSPEFMDPANNNAKYKAPLRYIVSILRATGARPDDYNAVRRYLREQGEPLYGCLTPDGYKNVRGAWLNPDALVHRANFTVQLVNNHFKGVDPGPIDARDLQDTLGLELAPATSAAIDKAPGNLKPALMLGCPEFMLY
jgi:uncharacterized protein (DUF1800 family)